MPSMTYLSGVLTMLFAISAITRMLPFAFAKQLIANPLIRHLGTQLPACIMFALLLHLLGDVTTFSYPYAIPEALCIGLVVATHMWKRNTALSIMAGTIPYVLIQTFVM